MAASGGVVLPLASDDKVSGSRLDIRDEYIAMLLLSLLLYWIQCSELIQIILPI